MLLLGLLLIATFVVVIEGYIPLSSATSRHHHESLLASSSSNDDGKHPFTDQLDFNGDSSTISDRRQLLQWSGSLALAPFLATAPIINTDYLNAMVDLPPIPTGYGRIFFCRHGQTENNRLRLVQDARINIGINDLGKQQGQRAGLALARASPQPSQFFCSPLIRARETAQEAAAAARNEKGTTNKLQLANAVQELDALKEVDFGPVAEGQLVSEAKPAMAATYARWAIGNIDYRPEGGGDSGRDVSTGCIVCMMDVTYVLGFVVVVDCVWSAHQSMVAKIFSLSQVLYRAAEAVSSLAKAAASDQCPNQCIAAFTHSTHLRILLGLFMGESLAAAANLKTNNGSINVLDVNLMGKTKVIGPKSKLLGGILSRAPKDFYLEIPDTKVLRINEIRHLEGL